MQITDLLQSIHNGDSKAMDLVIPLVYGELKLLAAGHLRRERGKQSLETTALVHEAFLRLAGGSTPSYENRAHFFGIASHLMRQILVDFARAQTADKRSAEEVCLAEIPELSRGPDSSVLAVDAALHTLAKTDPLKAQLIEMRFFGGMTAEETALALSLSPHQIRRHLRIALAWIKKELAG